MAETKQAKRAPQVDSLRALAALTVVFVHAMVFAGLIYRDSLPRVVMSQFDIAVTVLFGISGFVLYRPFVRAHIGRRTTSMRTYTIRRLTRIGPAYWVALAISAVVLGWSYVFTPTGFINYFGFLYLYSDNPLSAIQPGWTLCVELSFYVFLPIWAFALWCMPARERDSVLRLHLWGLGVLMALSGLYTVLVLQYGGLGNVNPGGTWQVAWLPARISDFAIGMVLAVLSVKWAEGGPPRWFTRARSHPVVLALAAAVIFAAAVILVTQDYSAIPENGVLLYFGHADFVIRMLLFWPLAALLMIPAAFPRDGSHIDRFLSTRWLSSLGLVSYGMYLWHWPILVFFNEHTPLADVEGNVRYLAWLAATVAATIGMAILSYIAIERPAINWAHRVTTRDRRDGPTAAAPPLVQPEKG